MRRPTQLKVCRHRVNNVLNLNTIHFARMVQHKKKGYNSLEIVKILSTMGATP